MTNITYQGNLARELASAAQPTALFLSKQVKILTTKLSEHFMERSEAYSPEAYGAFTSLHPPVPVLSDADEWGVWNAVGDPVLHIQVKVVQLDRVH